MPLIIAALVYGAVAALALAIVTAVALARGRWPGPAVLAGAVCSVAGFLLGCAAAVLVCVAAPGVGGGVGATALVVPAGLIGASLGAAFGVAAAGRAWPPQSDRQAQPDAADGGA